MRGKKISIRFVSNVSNVKIENPQIKVGILLLKKKLKKNY